MMYILQIRPDERRRVIDPLVSVAVSSSLTVLALASIVYISGATGALAVIETNNMLWLAVAWMSEREYETANEQPKRNQLFSSFNNFHCAPLIRVQ